MSPPDATLGTPPDLRSGASSSAPTPRGRSVLAVLPPYIGVLTVWLLLLVVLAVAAPQFANAGNLSNILRTSSVLFVVAIGVTFTVLTGGIDLSVGSLLALTGVVLVGLLQVVPQPLAVLGALAFAAITAGTLNGMLIGRLRLPAFVVTLGTLAAFRGVTLVATDGRTTYVDQFGLVTWLGDGNLGPVPVPALVMALVFGIAFFVQRFAYFGRDVYAIGGNADAARLSGIPVGRVTTIVYTVSGLTAGLAGVLQAGRLASVSPTVATGIELQVAAAVLLGGTSLAGGTGGVVGTLVGVLFLATVDNGLTILGVSAFWQQIVVGLILVAAVLLDRLRLHLSSLAGTSRKATADHTMRPGPASAPAAAGSGGGLRELAGGRQRSCRWQLSRYRRVGSGAGHRLRGRRVHPGRLLQPHRAEHLPTGDPGRGAGRGGGRRPPVLGGRRPAGPQQADRRPRPDGDAGGGRGNGLPADATALQPAIDRAAGAGIQVFAVNYELNYDANPPSDPVLGQVIEGREQTAQEQAAYLDEVLGGEGGVIYVGLAVPVAALEGQAEMCATALEEYPGLELLERVDNPSDDSAGARPLIDAMLAKYPDGIDAVVNYNDPSALGAYQAVQSAGLEDDILILGLQLQPEGVEGVQDGRIDADWDFNPTEMGQALGEMTVAALAGEPASEWRKTVVNENQFYDGSTIGDFVPWTERLADLAG